MLIIFLLTVTVSHGQWGGLISLTPGRPSTHSTTSGQGREEIEQRDIVLCSFLLHGLNKCVFLLVTTCTTAPQIRFSTHATTPGPGELAHEAGDSG